MIHEATILQGSSCYNLAAWSIKSVLSVWSERHQIAVQSQSEVRKYYIPTPCSRPPSQSEKLAEFPQPRLPETRACRVLCVAHDAVTTFVETTQPMTSFSFQTRALHPAHVAAANGVVCDHSANANFLQSQLVQTPGSRSRSQLSSSTCFPLVTAKPTSNNAGITETNYALHTILGPALPAGHRCHLYCSWHRFPRKSSHSPWTCPLQVPPQQSARSNPHSPNLASAQSRR